MAGNFIAMVFAVLRDKGVDTKGMSPDEAVEKYEELTGKTGRYSTANGEKDKNTDDGGEKQKGKAFIALQLFSPGIEQMSRKELVRSQRSINKKKILHEDKISNPEKYVPDWDSYSEQEKNGLKLKWQKEIINYDNQLKRIKERLDEH